MPCSMCLHTKLFPTGLWALFILTAVEITRPTSFISSCDITPNSSCSGSSVPVRLTSPLLTTDSVIFTVDG